MKFVYLVRHGESTLNAQNRHQGWIPRNPLTSDGHVQAKNAGAFLKDHPIEHIISSPLLRARQTSKIISQHLDVPIRISHGLIEFRRSKSQEGMLKEECLMLPEFQYWLRNINNRDFSLPDGDSLNQFRRRIVRFAKRIGENTQQESVLLVTHQSPIQELILHWTGEHIELSEIPNCAIFRIHLDSKELEVLRR